MLVAKVWRFFYLVPAFCVLGLEGDPCDMPRMVPPLRFLALIMLTYTSAAPEEETASEVASLV